MLKKSKNTKYPSPPAPPAVEEMLKDIETFHVELNTENISRQSPSSDAQHQDWWARFEQAVRDQKSLIMLNNEIRSYELKLESKKIELETESQLLENAVQEQREQIEEMLSKAYN